jgi:hypothetical protein
MKAFIYVSEVSAVMKALYMCEMAAYNSYLAGAYRRAHHHSFLELDRRSQMLDIRPER